MNPHPDLPMSPDQWDDFMRSPASMHVDIVELRRRDYAARVAIDERELDVCRRGTVREMRDHANRRLVQELRVAIFGKDHPGKHVIRFPADWWQAVKDRFAPAWFRDRWPVRFTEVTASLAELYPHVKPCLTNESPVMRFHVHRRDQYPIW